MKNLKNIIIVTCLALIIYGCKDIQCHGYPENANYFPYEKEQEIKFSNSKNEVKSLIIYNTIKTDSYSFDWNCKCVCNASVYFITHENADSISITGLCNIIGGRGDISFLHFNVDLSFSNPSHYSDKFYKKLNPEKKVPINEFYKYLPDTIYLENENNITFKELVLVRNKGIVSFTTADGEIWNSVN